VSLDVDRDGVKAVVKGSRAEPYKVTIQFTRLSDAEWDRVIDAMAAEALYAARLLSGEMPEQIEALFSSSSVGSSLFPADEGDLVTDCSCPDPANPCKHIAAAHYLLGERFDEDPFLMFLLRGRSRDEIVAELRARRAGPDTEASPEVEQIAEPDLSTFWSAPPQTEEVALHFALPESDALAVKRLGPPPFVRDQAAMVAAMERLYRQIGEYALLLALETGSDPARQVGAFQWMNFDRDTALLERGKPCGARRCSVESRQGDQGRRVQAGMGGAVFEHACAFDPGLAAGDTQIHELSGPEQTQVAAGR
jgi:uncharacterized Zn finger protein